MAKRAWGWRPESFRAMAVERARTSMHIGRLCEELGVSPGTLRKWRRQMEARREAAPAAAQLAGETLDEENRRPQIARKLPTSRPSRYLSVLVECLGPHLPQTAGRL
jgi:transposase-like protein